MYVKSVQLVIKIVKILVLKESKIDYVRLEQLVIKTVRQLDAQGRSRIDQKIGAQGDVDIKKISATGDQEIVRRKIMLK